MTLGLKTYRTLAARADPLFSFLLKRRTLKGKEDPDRVTEKKGFASIVRAPGPLVWLHGASVGESLSILPLLERMAAARSDLRFLITTGTRTSADLIRGRLPVYAVHQYAPLDHPAYWDRFYAHWRPDIAIVIESELWPNMIMGARARNIPLVLANARLSEKSARGWSRVHRSIGHLLSAFNLVLAQDERSAERLRRLGAEPVETPGNLKFDAEPLQADAVAFENLTNQIGGRPCWVAASTHEGEEALVGRIHAELRLKFPDLLTILVPRHPARGSLVLRELRESGLSVAQRSQADEISPGTDIYLADTLGELGVLFRLSSVAFIGGSFVDVGGHNPLEAARLNTAVLFGPHMFNFEEAASLLLDSGGAKQPKSETALRDALAQQFSAPDETQAMALRGKEAVAGSTRVAKKITEKILPLLSDSSDAKVLVIMRSPSFWYPASSPRFSDKFLRLALSPAAALYAAAAGIRQRMTVPERISVPVICVGNFTAGGAGKTPAAIAIAERLVGMGETPHFVSRGYGGREAGPVRVEVDRHSAEQVGDEPLLLSRHGPTWVSKDRVAGALAAERAGASAILLDDGFQNPALHKDLSLVVVDTGVGIGNGAVLPAGPLRETLSAALQRTHAIVALGGDLLSDDMTVLANQAAVPIFSAKLEPDAKVTSNLDHDPAIAFAGIGRPEKFFSTLRGLGVSLADTRSFPDHHPFTEQDAQHLLELAAAEKTQLITTEKDAVRLRGLEGSAGQQLLNQTKVLAVQAIFDDPNRLDGLLAQHLTAARASHTYAPPGTRRD